MQSLLSKSLSVQSSSTSGAQVHKSFIVNYRHENHVKSNQIEFFVGSRLSCSRKHNFEIGLVNVEDFVLTLTDRTNPSLPG